MTESFLSVGKIIHSMLVNDAAVRDYVGDKVYPLVKADAELPYICYRRAKTETLPVKTSIGSRRTTVEIACYAGSYPGSVYLAERVREALDNKTAKIDGLTMHGCYLIDAEESYGDDAFWQILTFQIRL